jgi:drug/metabolite transporter (DMT)-like permease
VNAAPAESKVVSPTTAAILLAVSVFFLGINWPILKIAMHSIGPLWFTAIRMILVAAILTAILAVRGRFIIPTRADMPMVLSLGILQFGAMLTLVVYGVSVVGAGRSAMLVYTTTIWITLGAIFVFGEKPTRGQIAGVVFGVAGLVTLFSPFGVDWNDRHTLLGNGAVVLSAIAWSIPLLQVRHHRWQADPLQLMPYQAALGALVSLVSAIFLESPLPHIAFGWEFVWSTTVIVLQTNISFWGLVTAGRRLPPIALSIGQLATPVIGVVSAAILIAEIPSTADIVGLVLIVCGMAVAALFGRRRAA